MNIFSLMESISSVALSHADNHDCDICLAAAGDQKALWRIYADLDDEGERSDIVSTEGKPFKSHSSKDCGSEYCCIHNPSNHHMVKWPMYLDAASQLMVRECEHAVNHPDPDSLAFFEGHAGSELHFLRKHACDGCCVVS